MLKVASEHKYLLEYISEDETVIIGKLISQCSSHRYKKNIPNNSILIFEKNHHQHKPFIFNYNGKKYFKLHENALVCYDNLK